MEELEQSKHQLKDSLKRLQDTVFERINSLEGENNILRTQIIQLKQEILKFKTDSEKLNVPTKSKGATKAKQKSLEADLLNTEASNEIDLTLSELKKLVGQN